MSGGPAQTGWDEVYQNPNPPPWDIGRPQPVFVDLVAKGEIAPPGRLLDVGCGTGENAIYFGQNGLSTVGVDFSMTAIERARTKARERKVKVDFRVGNALELEFKDEGFNIVTDSGLFHVFKDKDRALFVNEIGRVLKKDGRYFMMCFSEKEPADWGGPRRVAKDEIMSSFAPPVFRVDYVRDSMFATRIHEDGGRAYLVKATRI